MDCEDNNPIVVTSKGYKTIDRRTAGTAVGCRSRHWISHLRPGPYPLLEKSGCCRSLGDRFESRLSEDAAARGDVDERLGAVHFFEVQRADKLGIIESCLTRDSARGGDGLSVNFSVFTSCKGGFWSACVHAQEQGL